MKTKRKTTKARKIKMKVNELPTVTKRSDAVATAVPHYTPSDMIAFTTNPILYRIKKINREHIDTAKGIRAVIGDAFHKAMEVYYGGGDMAIQTESEAIEVALAAGNEYIDQYNDGWINYGDSIPNKQRAREMFTFAFNSYISEMPNVKDQVTYTEEMMKEHIDCEWQGKQLSLPVALKGKVDRVDTLPNGDIEVIDYKTVSNFSDPDKIDGKKMIQAVVYYFLVYAKTKVAPKRMRYEEVKITKNRDGGPQVKCYSIEYADNVLFFQFFFRLYEDVSMGLAGKMVYPPNLDALYDNEVAIVAYIHGLDLPEKVAELKLKHQTEDITEILKLEMQKTANMQKLLETIERSTNLAKAIDYTTMQEHEKIQTKLLEHGIIIRYNTTLQGASVNLYTYMPSIGLKMKKLESYKEDIEQVLGISGVRILAPIQNSTLIGFEVPRADRTFPTLPTNDGWNIAIGQRATGEVRRFDIRTAPHVLVAGSSGSGKSYFLHSLIAQILPLDDAELHLYDPKHVEFAKYAKKATDWQTEPQAINIALGDLKAEMHHRYRTLKEKGLTHIDQLSGKTKMRYIIAIVDEFGSLTGGGHTRYETVESGKTNKDGFPIMKTIEYDVSKEIETSIREISALGRAAGIHLVLATQRPSADIMKGLIKANFTTKVVFKTASEVNSRLILDQAGAEKLMGKGDMLFDTEGTIERLQGYALDIH